MDERFKKINTLLSNYSLGRFDKKLPLSTRLDEVDAFIAGVNMLGEELKATTISRDYFNNIFNSVSDMVLVLDKKGQIENTNKSVKEQLGYELDSLSGKSIDLLLPVGDSSVFAFLSRELKKNNTYAQKEITLASATGAHIPALVSANYLLNNRQRRIGYLVIARDITLQKETENLVIRTITDTQEKERQRFAKDIHDSLGQQISAIKFYIGTAVSLVHEEKQKEILLKSNDALVRVLADMRNICFNLMPKTLETIGLRQAVKELCNQTSLVEHLHFNIRDDAHFPALNKSLEIAIFRIIQEFINNAIKHGQASRIDIIFRHQLHQAFITLKENGKGFDLRRIQSRGMGLTNVQSRLQSYNGNVQISSAPGKGTKYELTLPVNG